MTTASGDEKLRGELQSKAAAAEAAGDIAAAERWLRQAIEVDARRAEDWMELAKFQTRTGNLGGGIESLIRAAELAPNVKKFVQLSQLESQRKGWEAADSWLARAEALQPHQANLPALRGNLAMEQHRYAAAAEHYERAVARAPRDPNLLQTLCYLLSFNDLDAAAARLECFLVLPDLRIGDRVMAMRLLISTKERIRRAAHEKAHGPLPKALGFHFTTEEIAAWLRDIQRWLDQEPASIAAWQMMVQALIAAGATMEAEPYFAKLRALGGNDVAAVTYLDLGFHEALDRISPATMQAALPPVIPVGGQSGTWSRVIFAGCDLNYAEQYASPLIGSFIRHQEPDTLFHLHLFDSTEEEAAAFLRRVEKAGQTHVTISREWTGFRDPATRQPPTQRARGYYHAIRYVRFREFLDQHPKAPAAMVDADILFNRAPSGFFSFLNGRDLVCPVGTGRIEIHNQLTACAVGLSATPLAHKYLHRVAAYLFLCWQQNRLPWGVDQTALYVVYMAMAAAGEALDLQDLPGNIFDIDFGDESVLWMGKCSPEHREYEKYLAAVSRFHLPS